jgi:hypothetical protein
MKLTNNELTTLWLGGFRYYLGRQTYAVEDFCNCLISNWSFLPDHCKRLIAKELKEAFKQDDLDRLDEMKTYHRLGHNCDRQSWAKVLDVVNKYFVDNFL